MKDYTTAEGVNYKVCVAGELTKAQLKNIISGSEYYNAAAIYAKEEMKHEEKKMKALARLNSKWTPRNKAAYEASKAYRNNYLSSIAMGFDIETTTVKDLDENNNLLDARSYMYHWQFSLNNYIICGRTWDQFDKFLRELYPAIVDELKQALKRKGKRWGKKSHPHCVIWVANLPFEFQYIKDRFNWDKLFAKDNRKTVTAEISTMDIKGTKESHPIIMFQDCLQITNTNLENLAKDYTTTQKRVGDLDYNELRNSMTPLTDEELAYCYDDVAILSEWHNYYYNHYSKLGFAPLTSTGILRHEVKRRQTVGDLQEVFRMFPGMDEYKYVMDWCFKGGYAHANLANVNKEFKGCVYSWDITSSYPYVMLHNLFPMERFSPDAVLEAALNSFKDVNDLYDFIKAMYGKCLFYAEVEISTPEAIKRNTYISLNKCKNAGEINAYEKIYADDNFPVTLIDNGRILRTQRTVTVETDLDILTLLDMYSYSEIKFTHVMSCYKLAVLPRYITDPIEEAYDTKAKLKKAHKSKTIQYKVSKMKVNAGYGMMCTKLIINDLEYDPETHVWKAVPRKKVTLEDQAFLNPMWGIWVTAYARRRLMEMVIEAGDNTVVCDTDSIYCMSTPEIVEAIEKENTRVLAQNQTRFNGNPSFDDLGCWDKQSVNDKKEFVPYDRFATMGAKRYVLQGWNDEKYGWKQTIAGLPKGIIEKFVDKYNKAENKLDVDPDGIFENKETIDPMDVFIGTNGFYLDEEESGKKTTHYHDTDHSDYVTDKYGNTELMYERSSVSIVNIPFKMTIKGNYIESMKWLISETVNVKKEVRLV